MSAHRPTVIRPMLGTTIRTRRRRTNSGRAELRLISQGWQVVRTPVESLPIGVTMVGQDPKPRCKVPALFVMTTMIPVAVAEELS